MGRLTFEFPPRSLRANSRAGAHWGTVHKDKKAYRASCVAVIESVRWGEPKPGPVPLAVIAYYGKGERMGDLSDLGFLAKTPIDCLVQCGVFENDSPAHLRPFFADCERGERSMLVILWADDARERMRLK